MAAKSTTPGNFQTYLSRRWAEGCTTGRDLLPEIKCLGYTGSLTHLERLLSRGARQVARLALTARGKSGHVDLIPPRGNLISPIIAAALCVKPRGLLTKAQAAKVDAFSVVGRLRHHARTGDAVPWYSAWC